MQLDVAGGAIARAAGQAGRHCVSVMVSKKSQNSAHVLVFEHVAEREI